MEHTRGWGDLGGYVAYEYMLVISLYRVIGRMRMMTLHLGVVNGRSGMLLYHDYYPKNMPKTT